MTVADMQGCGRSEHPFRGPGLRRNNQIVTAQIKLLEREWLQEKRMPMELVNKGNLLQKRSCKLSPAQTWRHHLRFRNQREQIGLGKHVGQCFHHMLSPG